MLRYRLSVDNIWEVDRGFGDTSSEASNDTNDTVRDDSSFDNEINQVRKVSYILLNIYLKLYQLVYDMEYSEWVNYILII